jgi:L-ribulose-5-phosphate 4-epimerase
MYEAERRKVVETARLLIERRVLSLSLHANISARISGSELFVMTGSSLADLNESTLAIVSLAGEVVWGSLAPAEREVLGMHTAFYAQRPDAGAVIHTHSPYGTAFAVASRPLPIVAESLARWGFSVDVPVARWAPRGSEASISNIAEALKGSPSSSAVLLENHGILVSGDDLQSSARKVIAIEENAQLAVLSAALGGPRALGAEETTAARARREEFQAGQPDVGVRS